MPIETSVFTPLTWVPSPPVGSRFLTRPQLLVRFSALPLEGIPPSGVVLTNI
jgi:hypothetical protein